MNRFFARVGQQYRLHLPGGAVMVIVTGRLGVETSVLGFWGAAGSLL
jgi:hypothetical protein